MADDKSASAAIGAPQQGGSKLVLILTLVNVLVTGAMLALLLMSFNENKKKPTVGDIAANAEAEAAGGHGAKKEGGGHGGEKKKEGGHGGKKGEGEAGHKPVGAEFGPMITLEMFTINLDTRGSANPKYARVTIALEVPTEDGEREINAKVPRIRNTIIDLFNSKRPADLATSEQREFLKEEVKNALNGFLQTKVTGVFFTNFAIAG